MNTLTIETLRALLRYEPETGKLYWRERSVDWFTDGKHTAERVCRSWNSRYANKEALGSTNGAGYKHGLILRKPLLCHRVIWAMETGAWPIQQIDHINHDRTDNKIVNLREVSSRGNRKNAALRQDNTSGVTGVCWHKTKNKWEAQIRENNKLKTLGRFKNKSDAIDARKAAEIKYGYHKNHGK